MLNDSNTICSYIYFSYCTRIDKKLKYLYTDTTCIKNKYGSELVKYNGHKKMNCTKVSFITDSNGIPINVGIFSGSKHDSQIFIEQLNNKMLMVISERRLISFYYFSNVKLSMFCY